MDSLVPEDSPQLTAQTGFQQHIQVLGVLEGSVQPAHTCNQGPMYAMHPKPLLVLNG